jgi:hypothetical protein
MKKEEYEQCANIICRDHPTNETQGEFKGEFS